MVSGVGSRTPSWNASISPRSTESGVRSSCEMSATHCLRAASFFSSVSASVLKSRESWPSSSEESPGTRVSNFPDARRCVADARSRIRRTICRAIGMERSAARATMASAMRAKACFCSWTNRSCRTSETILGGTIPEIADRLTIMHKRPQRQVAGRRSAGPRIGFFPSSSRTTLRRNPPPGSWREASCRIMGPIPGVPGGAAFLRGIPGRPGPREFPGPFRERRAQQVAQPHRVVLQEPPGSLRGVRLLEPAGDGLEPLLVESMDIPQEPPVEAPPHHEEHAEHHGGHGGQQGEEHLVLDPEIHSFPNTTGSAGKPPAWPPSPVISSFPPHFLHIPLIFMYLR